MAIDCEVCQELRDTSNIFTLFGITEELCNSLKNNTGLNPNLAVAHDNCTDLTNMIDCLVGRLKEEINIYDPCDYRPMMEILLKNLYTVFTALKCSDCGQWDNIDDLWEQIRLIWIEINELKRQIGLIWTEIDNIYNIINALSGINFITLRRGTDYELYFYNGFHIEEAPGDLNIRLSETNDAWYLQINADTSNASRNLQNDNLNNVQMKHGTNIEEVPLSHMFRVQFLGNYAAINNATNWSNTSGASNGIFNIYPKNLRASWQHSAGAYRNTSRGTGWLFAFASYADGYNTQLYDEYQADTLEGRYLNFTFTMTIGKPS